MKAKFLAIVVLSAASGLSAQAPAQTVPPTATRPDFNSFEVATIKPVEQDPKGGRYLVMQSPHRLVAKDYSLKQLIAAAYDLNPHAVMGGPSWLESAHFDITALTPGDVKPTRDEQMKMLKALLAERFKLTFHREQKVFSIYELQQAKGGQKLRSSAEAADATPVLISVVYPEKIVLPARNATMEEFALVLQRAILDRPVVDKTGLAGRFDFDLEWAPDDSQFGGEVATRENSTSPPLFTAMQEQLGLKLEATRGPIPALVVDAASQPTAN